MASRGWVLALGGRFLLGLVLAIVVGGVLLFALGFGGWGGPMGSGYYWGGGHHSMMGNYDHYYPYSECPYHDEGGGSWGDLP